MEINIEEDGLQPMNDFFESVYDDKRDMMKDFEGSNRPPEARLRKTSKDGVVEIFFT